MKSVSVLILLIVISACNCATTVYEEGKSGGVLLYSGDIGSTSVWAWVEQRRKVRYPLPGKLEYDVPIGYLKIVDNMDSTYSAATVTGGGVGEEYAEIEYYAPAFRRYDYNVEIRAIKAIKS